MVRDDLRSTGIRETDVFPVVLGGMVHENGVRSLVGDVFREGGLSMNNKHIAIKREEIEVGMTVAYPYSVSVGWYRDFRYPRWVECSVKRITPKRTKAVLLPKGGTAIDVNLKEYSVYVPDVTMNRENTCLKKFLDCRKVLNNYDGGKWKALWALSDEELDEAHIHLMELSALFQKTKE